MNTRPAPNRTLFIGGPGRSGTSFTADRLARHPEVCAFRDVELKFFTEKGGLIDLWHSLGERYSPNRAGVAIEQFERLTDALITGRFGQPAFTTAAPEQSWRAIVGDFLCALRPAEHPVQTDWQLFQNIAGRMIRKIAALAANQKPEDADPRIFLEKTPHSLLAGDFLAQIAPASSFLHVMRDPRSVANSLLAMRWGPDTLKACCTWVAAYCDAWTRAEARAAYLGLDLHRVRIEDICRAPEEMSASVCKKLGLAPHSSLFDGASLVVLNGWADDADPHNLDVLQKRLNGWARHFGYELDAIGKVEASQVPVAAETGEASSAVEVTDAVN